MNLFSVTIFLTVGLYASNAQELKTVTKRTSQTIIEEFEVLKSDKKIRNGKYLKKSSSGNLLTKGQFKDNLESGSWEFYDYSTGDLEQRFDYDKEKITYLNTENNPLNHFYYNEQWIMEKLDTIPVLIGGLSNLKLMLLEKAHSYTFSYTKGTNFPKEGTALFSFIVTKTGETKDFKILISSGNSFESELLKIIEKSGGKWIPGKFKGESVDTEFLILMNVRYRVNDPMEKTYYINFNYLTK